MKNIFLDIEPKLLSCLPSPAVPWHFKKCNSTSFCPPRFLGEICNHSFQWILFLLLYFTDLKFPLVISYFFVENFYLSLHFKSVCLYFMEHFYNSCFRFFVIEYLSLCILGTDIFCLIIFSMCLIFHFSQMTSNFLLYLRHFKHYYEVVGHLKILWRIFLLAGNQSSFFQAIISESAFCGLWFLKFS